MKKTNPALNAIINGIDIIGKLLLIFIMVFPFLWMVSTAFQTYEETLTYPPTLIPASLQWQNFITVFETIPILKFLKNSLVVCACVVVFQYFFMVPAAYSLAKIDYKAKPLVFAIVMLGQMIPSQLTFLPVYFMFSNIGWLNTYRALIVPSLANAFGIFMLRQYFMQIPTEVIEAARMDDASELKIMFRIMLPMVKPIMITLALLTLIGTWNSYFWPLIMTTKDTVRTLPIALDALKDSEGQRYNIIMAGNMLLTMPMLLLYMVASKKIRGAFVYSGIK